MQPFLSKNNTVIECNKPVVYWLKRNDDEQITPEMMDALDDSVSEHISNCLKEGYFCGELIECYVDENGNEIELSGWWG